MLLNKTKALAGVSILCALSVLSLLAGTFLAMNTLFFTALAAYLIGYSINQYSLKYGAMQWVVCTVLDFFLNPDKMNWILYVALGGYIVLCEFVFQKWNRIEKIRKKLRVQLFYNWIVFNVIYIPIIVWFRELLLGENPPEIVQGNSIVTLAILWGLGQIGWLVYDMAYRVFFRAIRERKL